MSRIKSSALTRGGVVGTGCDLESNSRLLGDFTVRGCLISRSASSSHRALGFSRGAHMLALRDGLAWSVIGPRLPQL